MRSRTQTTDNGVEDCDCIDINPNGIISRMKSDTAKLPKGHSYPLRPSALAEAIEAAGISIDVHLTRKPGNIFDAHFWPPDANFSYERVYIRAGTVPVERAKEIRLEIEEGSIPQLVSWLTGILTLDPMSPRRREKHWKKLI